MEGISICPKLATALAVLPLLGVLAGCGALDALNLRRPSARIAGVRLQDINLSSATLLFDVEVENPYSVPLPLVNIDYGLASGGTQFLSGKADMQGTVPAQGKKTVSLPARIVYLELLKALEGVPLGSVVPYRADLALSVDAPAVGVLRLPLHKEGQLPVPAVPDVKVEQIKWDRLTLDRARGVVTLSVTNRNEFPLHMRKLTCALSLGGTRVGSSAVAEAVSLDAAGGAGTLEIPISLSPRSLGSAVFKMLAGRGSDYRLTGDLEVNTPFGPMSIPINKLGKTTFRK